MHRIVEFFRDRRGGAMLFSGAIGLTVLGSVGAMMVNLTWQEAHVEELRGALRASLSASADLLRRATEDGVEAKIKERVADFMRGLAQGLTVDADDVTVTHDAATKVTWVTVGGSVESAFQNLWGAGEGNAVMRPILRVGVALPVNRYEVAVALNVGHNMRKPMPGDSSRTKMQVALDALESALSILEEKNTKDPGSLAIALVPYSNMVNVADTSGSGETAGKRRYARMLTGAEISAGTVSDAAKNTDNHYYDLYTSYGRSLVDDMDKLISRKLPITETTPDWNLREEDEDIELTTLMPGTSHNWTVDGKDFWNGCVMHRWGAYWEPDARPSDWDADDLNNNSSHYPAKTTPAIWSTGGPTMSPTPLWYSDAPPDVGDPNTRFTAFSYPDSSIGGSADSRIEALLKETLTPGSVVGTATTPGKLIETSTSQPVARIARMRGGNDWGLGTHPNVVAGGHKTCTLDAIQPLTNDVTELRNYIAAFNYQPQYGGTGSAALPHLAVIWGVRVLSPLWQEIWDVTDSIGRARALAPCYGNNTANCTQQLKKVIVLFGADKTQAGVFGHGGTAFEEDNSRNPLMNAWNNKALCSGTQQQLGLLPTGTGVSDWKDAANEKDPSDFNNLFGTNTGGGGTFTQVAAEGLVRNWYVIFNGTSVANSTSIIDSTMVNLFQAMTPWQLFRGDEITNNCSVSDVFAGKTSGGCTLSGGSNLNLDGRLIHRPACRPKSVFGPFGEIDALVRVGKWDVVENVAPFQSPEAPTSWTVDTDRDSLMAHGLQEAKDWFLKACEFAGDRDIDIVGVTISRAGGRSVMEDCVDKAGGAPGERNVIVAGTATDLENTFRSIFLAGAKLRFLN